MSFDVKITDKYAVRRIDDWSINVRTNQIFGTMVLKNSNIPLMVTGKILSFIDNHVMVTVYHQLYALVLGFINPRFADVKHHYIKYLKAKERDTNIVI